MKRIELEEASGLKSELKAEGSADTSVSFKVDKLKGERRLKLLQGELGLRKDFFEFKTLELRQGEPIKYGAVAADKNNHRELK